MVCNRIPFGTMPAQVTPHPPPPFTLALTSGSENGSGAEAAWPGRSSVMTQPRQGKADARQGRGQRARERLGQMPTTPRAQGSAPLTARPCWRHRRPPDLPRKIPHLPQDQAGPECTTAECLWPHKGPGRKKS